MDQNIVVTNEQKINILTNVLIDIENGETIIGDGKEIVHNDIAPLKHMFADQVYVRQMDIKQGVLIVGAIHKHLHVWFLLTGNLTIATKNGVEDFIAPCYVVSQPGSQRVIYANEDSIFVNVHKNPTNTQDITELEKEIVALNKKEYEKYVN